jgi:ubiquinone/menaquinone biosynthesis C-methylase UbiE
VTRPFEDHFSHASSDYAAHRPRYPSAFFEYVASVAPAHDAIWDVGTGSGQGAIELAAHFSHVHATDASANQIASAQAHDRVTYTVALAEDSRLPDTCVDAITVCQALHWFDLPRFTEEAKRVARPGVPLVACTYAMPRAGDAIDPLIQRFHDVTVGPFWPMRRHDPLEAYANLELPLPRLDAPVLELRSDWTLAQFLNYIATWSAVKQFRDAKNIDPIPTFADELRRVWPDPALPRPVTATLTVKAWRIE